MPTLSYADFDGPPPSSALTQAKAAWLLAIRRQLHRLRGLISNPLLSVAGRITTVVEVVNLSGPLAARLDLVRRCWGATSSLWTPARRVVGGVNVAVQAEESAAGLDDAEDGPDGGDVPGHGPRFSVPATVSRP